MDKASLRAIIDGVTGAPDTGAVAEMVPAEKLSNAVGLNSASFNAARLIGPGVAGLAIAWVGTGWVFILNGISFAATIFALTRMRKRELNPMPHAKRHERGQIRAATGPDYGRIFDWEILAPIKRLVDETGGRWKVPGMMTGNRNGLAVYDPDVPVTLETTTLYASDRDVFVFLVDDRNPISIGTLPNGEPDLMFRGFYAWNSETGSKTAGVAAMYIRGVCRNRNLWGVENFHEVKIRHTKFAPERFAAEVRPALASFANASTAKFIEGVNAAKAAIVAKDDDARLEFLTKRVGLSARMAKAAAARHVQEEGQPMRSVWDAAQAITALARDIPHQDARVELERKAGALLDKVAA